jgi:hypothetical protein
MLDELTTGVEIPVGFLRVDRAETGVGGAPVEDDATALGSVREGRDCAGVGGATVEDDATVLGFARE